MSPALFECVRVPVLSMVLARCEVNNRYVICTAMLRLCCISVFGLLDFISRNMNQCRCKIGWWHEDLGEFIVTFYEQPMESAKFVNLHCACIVRFSNMTFSYFSPTFIKPSAWQKC